MNVAAPAGADAPFESYAGRWLALEPEWRVVRLFLPEARTPVFGAFSCLARVLREAVFSIREASVSQAKLGWWLEEISRSGSAPRHPITRRLHELGRGPAVAAQGPDLVAAAFALSRLESPADMQAVLHPFRAFARAEARFAQALALRAAPHEDQPSLDAAAAALLLGELRWWQRFVDPARARLPLDALAHGQVARESLAGSGQHPVAAALAADLGKRLQAPMRQVPARQGEALDRALRLIGDRLAGQMRHRPRQATRGESSVLGPGLVWGLWRIARTTAR